MKLQNLFLFVSALAFLPSAIFSQSDVDGGLIGGAALKAEDFSAIVQST